MNMEQKLWAFAIAMVFACVVTQVRIALTDIYTEPVTT